MLRESALGWLSERNTGREVGTGGGLASSGLKGSRLGGQPGDSAPCWLPPHLPCFQDLSLALGYPGSVRVRPVPCSQAEKDLGPAFMEKSEGFQRGTPSLNPDRHPENEGKPKQAASGPTYSTLCLCLPAGERMGRR